MSFKFKLETVLSYKQTKENEALQKLAQARETHLKACQDLDSLKNILKQQQHLTTERIDISSLLIRQAYVERIEKEIVQQLELIAVLNREEEAAQKKVVNALKERKALEKLKEKHQKDHLAEALKLEQKALDETALSLYYRS